MKIEQIIMDNRNKNHRYWKVLRLEYKLLKREYLMIVLFQQILKYKFEQNKINLNDRYIYTNTKYFNKDDFNIPNNLINICSIIIKQFSSSFQYQQ